MEGEDKWKYYYFFLVVLIWIIVYLTSGKINRKSDSRTLHTNKNVQEVVNLLRKISGELRANVDKI